MKEDVGDARLPAWLIENENWWAGAIPNCSVVYVGTPWFSMDTNGDYTIIQNSLVRSTAVAYGHAYVDCMNPAVSYEWMLASDFMDDATNADVACNSYLAGIAWDDLGFFAVGAPMRLDIARESGGTRLSFGTATNILYDVQGSTDLGQWSTVATVPGGTNADVVVPASDARNRFRLRLRKGDEA
jgi:hypothetical protein